MIVCQTTRGNCSCYNVVDAVAAPFDISYLVNFDHCLLHFFSFLSCDAMLVTASASG